ncbi:MAG: protein kinase [Acidobacteria bacterium]|nr:protein kinase [Acidobacteriota bacterium]MBV9475267.1 protein kinase [Acidobacteriota bacterium]
MTSGPLPTRQYGDYDLESFLGKGSIGKVYLARHRRIGRRVALKTVHLEQKFEDEIDRNEFYRRLQREAELCAVMQHPNIVTLYDVGYEDDVVTYLATEYIDGESLLGRLRRTRPLPLGEALAIAFDLLRGLAYAHGKGIIHRDIKPANILLTSEGQAKVADFGVARPLHSSLTTSRSLVGTPNYMSPEQVKTTPVSPRSDLFSAGVVIYEMLTGTKPFAAPELSAILYNIVNLTPPPVHELNPSVPPAISQVIARLLAKDPADRYESANDALRALDAARPATTPAASTPLTAAPLPLASEAETIAVMPHDATTPLPTIVDPIVTRPILRRRVPGALFWTITLLLIAGLATAVVLLRHSAARQKPAAVLPPSLVAQTDAKRRALENARALVRGGAYADAIRAYDALLARAPEMEVAREERAEAQRLLDAATPKAEVTKTARKTKRVDDSEPAAQAQQQQPAKKPSRWERVKHWFRGK